MWTNKVQMSVFQAKQTTVHCFKYLNLYQNNYVVFSFLIITKNNQRLHCASRRMHMLSLFGKRFLRIFMISPPIIIVSELAVLMYISTCIIRIWQNQAQYLHSVPLSKNRQNTICRFKIAADLVAEICQNFLPIICSAKAQVCLSATQIDKKQISNLMIFFIPAKIQTKRAD